MDLRAAIAAELEAAGPRPVKHLPAPWGKLFLRTMELPELLHFEEMQPPKGDPSAQDDSSQSTIEANVPRFAWLLATCLVDDAGAPVLTHDQAKALAARNISPFLRLANQCLALHGFAAEGIEEQKKSSSAPPG